MTPHTHCKDKKVPPKRFKKNYECKKKILCCYSFVFTSMSLEIYTKLSKTRQNIKNFSSVECLMTIFCKSIVYTQYHILTYLLIPKTIQNHDPTIISPKLNDNMNNIDNLEKYSG